jgi:hypothetical protein
MEPDGVLGVSVSGSQTIFKIVAKAILIAGVL